MSTRGLFMIRKDGEDKGVYIPHDAYPNVAGEAIYDFLHSVGINLDRIYKRMTDDEWSKTPELDTFLISAVNQNGLLYYNEDKDFIYDSLMCEHAYIINLDDKTLEYYIGFQETPQVGNRYSGKVSSIGTYTGKTYYSCKLAAVFTLEYVKDTSKQDLINKMYGSESEEEIQYFGFKEGEVPVTEVRESKDLTMAAILDKTVSSCSKLSELQKAFEDPDKWDENIENLRLLLPIIKRDIFDLEDIVDYARGAV